MNPQSLFLIVTGVLLNAAAQLLLKAGTNTLGVLSLKKGETMALLFRVVTEHHIVGGLACYMFSVVIWIAALSRVEVSVAYPMLSIGYIVNAFAAWYLFGEALSLQKLSGIFVIVVGIVIMSRS